MFGKFKDRKKKYSKVKSFDFYKEERNYGGTELYRELWEDKTLVNEVGKDTGAGVPKKRLSETNYKNPNLQYIELEFENPNDKKTFADEISVKIDQLFRKEKKKLPQVQTFDKGVEISVPIPLVDNVIDILNDFEIKWSVYEEPLTNRSIASN